MSTADSRLAVYGSRAPGRPNHHVLADVGGTWTPGTVRGVLHEAGWGARLGFPGIRLDDRAGEVGVQVLESTALLDRWAELDAFEGPGYRRSVAVVSTPDGPVEAWIYELDGDDSGD